MHAVWTLRNNTPGRLLRSRFFWFGKWYTWNFNRDLQSDGDSGFLPDAVPELLEPELQRRARTRTTQNDRLTRGGPQRGKPCGRFFNMNGGTDSRKPLRLNGFFTRTGATATAATTEPA